MRVIGTTALLVAGVLCLGATTLRAEPPVYHGQLGIRPASGGIDRDTGVVSLKVKRWGLRPQPGSDGIFPADEPLVIAIGDTEQFLLPAGSLRPNRKGNKFTYRNPNKKVGRGIRLFRAIQSKSGDWKVKFKIVGVQLSRLTFEFPVCEKLAVIIGNDDGFSGVVFDRPDGYQGKRLKVRGACDDVDDWPWLD